MIPNVTTTGDVPNPNMSCLRTIEMHSPFHKSGASIEMCDVIDSLRPLLQSRKNCAFSWLHLSVIVDGGVGGSVHDCHPTPHCP